MKAMNTAPMAAPPRDLLEAMQALRADNPRRALELASSGMDCASDRAPYLAVASLAGLRLGEQERAIPWLRELLQINPADRASRANLANALIELGRKDEALELVTGRDEPGMARIEGFLRQDAGDLAGAAANYRQALAIDPDDLSSLNNLGNVLSEMGAYDDAIAAFERAITLAPADLNIYRNLAEALGKAERTEAQCRVLEDARKVAPDDVTVLVDLATVQAKLDDMEGAIATLRHAIDVSPEFSDAHIELGTVYENLNRVADLDALVASIDRENAPPEAAFLFAWQARRAGDFERAAEFAEQIPESIHAVRRNHLIGGIADRRGDIDTAFAAFEAMNRAAIESGPTLDSPTFRAQVESDLSLWSSDWAADWRRHRSRTRIATRSSWSAFRDRERHCSTPC